MQRTGTDEIRSIEPDGDASSITVRSEGSGTADSLHTEHPEFVAGRNPSLRHRLLDIFRKPFRD